MLMTESQAAVVWCPHSGARHVRHVQPAYEADADKPTADHSCIASRCASWRWKTDPDTHGPARVITPMYRSTGEKWSCPDCNGTGGVPSVLGDQAETSNCPKCDGDGSGTLQSPVGYCGLAGPLELLR